MKHAPETRDAVQGRAMGACEYCRLPQAASVLPHQIDHIIGRQHRGSDEVDNLCLCCVRCNLKKGPNIASVDPDTGSIVPLFHPRRQVWQEHFAVSPAAAVRGLSAAGRATVALLEMNDDDRVRLRAALMRVGLYP